MGNEASIQARAEAKAEEIALVQAVMSGDIDAMQTILKQSPHLIYAHSKAGENLWHFAAQGGNIEALKEVARAVEAALAAQRKQDKVNAQFTHGFNQVNQAVNKVISAAVPLPAAIAIPMSASLEVNAQTRDGVTPLIAAVKAGKAAAVQQLMAAGANAWLGDNTGATALHHAAWQGGGPCLSLLLQHAERLETAAGGKQLRLLESTTNTGLTALHYAAWRGQLDAIKQLVNAGAALAASASSDTMGMIACNAGSTPLHLAAMKGEVGAIRLLLRANARLMSLASVEGGAAVIAAMSSSSGARSDLRKVADRYGKTAATLAWDMQRSDLALILDPSTPLKQAITLAAKAAKGGDSSSTAPMQAPQQQKQPTASHSFRSSHRKPGEIATESGPASAAVAHMGIKGPAEAVAVAAQKLSIGSGASSSAPAAGGKGPGIVLPPPKAWHSKKQEAVSSDGSRNRSNTQPSDDADYRQQQQEQQQQQPIEHQLPQHVTPRELAAVPGEDGDSSNSPVQPAAAGPAPSAAAPADSAAVHYDAIVSAAGAEAPEVFLCPITLEVFKYPVRACDGLAYERDAIEMWFELGNTQFPGGGRIVDATLTPDDRLKQAIAAWRTAVAAAGSR